jgi:putative heme iron utilization protein
MSVELPGYPFGSVTPYCADATGRPIVYISAIAQHTRNIRANPKVSLTVVERVAETDIQAAGRVTCVANALPLDAPGADAERYFRSFPNARQYQGTHDFAFFRLELVRTRYIGGFGQIYWVEPAEFVLQNPFSPEQESAIIQHMNKDHRQALRRYAGGDATMIGIDAEGFDMLRDGAKVRLEFQNPIGTMEEARQALIALAKLPA